VELFPSQGILEKHSVTEVPLIITPQRLEEMEITSQFVIFGRPEMPLVSDKEKVLPERLMLSSQCLV